MPRSLLPLTLMLVAAISAVPSPGRAELPAGRPRLTKNGFLSLVKSIKSQERALVCTNNVWPGPATADRDEPIGIYVMASKAGWCDGGNKAATGPRSGKYVIATFVTGAGNIPERVDGRWLNAKQINHLLSNAGRAADELDRGNPAPAAQLMSAIQHAGYAGAKVKTYFDAYEYGKTRTLVEAALRRLK